MSWSKRDCVTLLSGFSKNLPEKLLVFNKSIDMILSSMFTRGNLKNKRYTQQGLLGVTVRHHLRGTKGQRQVRNMKQNSILRVVSIISVTKEI